MRYIVKLSNISLGLWCYIKQYRATKHNTDLRTEISHILSQNSHENDSSNHFRTRKWNFTWCPQWSECIRKYRQFWNAAQPINTVDQNRLLYNIIYNFF